LAAKIIVVDRDVSFIEIIVPLIKKKNIELAGVYKTYQHGLKAIKELQPDCMLTDFEVVGGSGLDLIRAARKLQPTLQTMIVTHSITQPDLFTALGVGAKGYVLKNTHLDELSVYLDQFLDGGSPITPYMARWLVKNINDLNQTVEGKPMLSNNELSILTLLSKGCSRDEMANIQNISHNTVSTYIKRIYKKLGVGSQTEAVFEAVQLGLIRMK
jgi:DNA-binding NarL/FixJ family response regulator